MIINDIFYLADEKQVIRRVEELKNRSSDIHSRLAKPLKYLWNPQRKLAQIESLDVFQDLYSRFPNFKEVIEYYETNAIVFKSLGQPFEATPILLQGDPGLGKTFFASELARLLAIDFYEISMATITANFVISGSNIQWGEGSPGFIANSLVSSKVGNPIMLLDEIDKSSSAYKYDPISAFYTLLESHSASRFKDEALEIEIDASKVIWIATSNYLEDIPEPIKSRMSVFNINNASIGDMPRIVNSIYQQVKTDKSYGNILSDTLSEDVVSSLIKLTPREIKKVIEVAIIKCIRSQRDSIQLDDLPKINKKESFRVGFI